MKIKNIFVIAVLAVLGPVWTSTNASPEQDIAIFQTFFLKRFPDVSLTAYSQGVSALPQHHQIDDKRTSSNTEDQISLDAELKLSQQVWQESAQAGVNLDNCFNDKPPATQYPYYNNDSGELHTIYGDIQNCFPDNRPGHEETIRLVAAFKSKFAGKPMSVDNNVKSAKKWFEKGKKFFWTRRGQLNFSCASCHVQNAGNRIRGQVLSAALGHTTSFPKLVLKRATEETSEKTETQEGWTDIHTRYAQCNKLARSKPFPVQSDEYRALEFYQALMDTGVPLNAPAYRE